MKPTVEIASKLTVAIAALVCLVFAPDARACNSLRIGGQFLGSSGLAAALDPSLSLQAKRDPPTGQQESERNDHAKNLTSRIVGMWITDLSTGGVLVDRTIEQFSSDGNELISSSGAAPATDNKCYGIWQASGARTVGVTHIGWDFDGATGTFKGTARLIIIVTLSRDGDSFTGTYQQDEIDPSGKTIFGPVEGTVVGTRFKPATSLDAIKIGPPA
jgi:hypothetical protein